MVIACEIRQLYRYSSSIHPRIHREMENFKTNDAFVYIEPNDGRRSWTKYVRIMLFLVVYSS